MQKQKKGFWLFIFSLIPGAGEMYMGFKKQGISIMLLFYSLFAIGACTGLDWIIIFFPIVWFYSFFNVHNLKSLSEEEFYSLEDTYILHLDEVLGNTQTLLTKYRLIIAVLLITLGASMLWSGISDVLYWILPRQLANMVHSFGYMLPQLVIAVGIILGGIYLIKNKKEEHEIKTEKELESEHFWQPYHPQNKVLDSNTETSTTAEKTVEKELSTEIKDATTNTENKKEL